MAIIKRRSWVIQNTPNLWSLDDFRPCYGNLKKIKLFQNNFHWRFREGKSKHCIFGSAITWLKIMQTFQKFDINMTTHLCPVKLNDFSRGGGVQGLLGPPSASPFMFKIPNMSEILPDQQMNSFFYIFLLKNFYFQYELHHIRLKLFLTWSFRAIWIRDVHEK